MSRTITLTLLLALVGLTSVAAQSDPTRARETAQQQAQDHTQHSHYAGRESSEIPALTDEQIEQLRNGDGMGFALPAELNSYPGPKHALELADDLGLSDEQKTRIEEVFAVMQQEAQALGTEIIEGERQLNTRFQHGHIDDATLRQMTASIAMLNGELRATHLSAHLQMKEILTAEQVARYDELRGYVHD